MNVRIDGELKIDDFLIKGLMTSYAYSREGINDIALISMVKNEEDIIFENLVWHFVLGFRKFVIADNASTDNTKQKIQDFIKLTKNHAKVFVIDDPIFEYIQSRITTAEYNLVRSVWPEVKWIFPVDADEFWITRVSFNEILSKISDFDKVSAKAPQYFASSDYYSFNEGSAFYEKLHCHANDDTYRFSLAKSAFKAQADIEIEQGNHGGHKVSNNKLKLSNIDGKFIGLEMREFPIRSAEHVHRKYYNSMQANLKAKEMKILSGDAGFHWDAYQKYINKFGDKAGEEKFKDSFIAGDNCIEDPLPIGQVLEIFNDIILNN